MEKASKPNDLLKRQRELRGWSQERLAEELGTNHVNISRWETGVTSPSPHYRSRLCDIFGKNAQELGLIGDETDLPDASSPSLSPRFWSLPLPSEHYYLVLVDNLETAENADSLVLFLQRLLGTSRAIVTSRKQVRYDFVRAHSLQGLTQEDALFFLQKEVQQRRGEHLQDLSEAALVEIYTVTGGAPLALKLVIAQTRFLDLDVVLRRLRHAGSKLYSFIYQQSWMHLSLIAQQLLLYIGQTVVTTVGWEELALVGNELDESEENVLEALDELCTASLLEVSSVSGQRRYGIHQLTRQFVTSELPQQWREQGLL